MKAGGGRFAFLSPGRKREGCFRVKVKASCSPLLLCFKPSTQSRIQNRIPSTPVSDINRDWPTGPDSRLLGCPATELDDVGRLLRHVNEMLEIIDATYEDEGGLLAAMPDLHSLLAEESNRQLRMEEAKTLCEGTILGQWMGFTQNLIKRVAELEREVVGLVCIPEFLCLRSLSVGFWAMSCGLRRDRGRVLISGELFG